MTPNVVLDAVTDLRASAFDLLEKVAHDDPGAVRVAETVDHLQVVANELGVIEALICDAEPMPGELRRRRYAARANFRGVAA
ncbi:MAG TPA: hypothetical protein VFB41_01095 [Solirubrobacteraceae bacterium]|nr:hypothetical protein [Solirubrobacteraceae bacterium]